MQNEATPSLDVRDVEDEHSRGQHRGDPNESRIGGFVHDGSCTYKSCAKPLTGSLISAIPAPKRSILVEIGRSGRPFECPDINFRFQRPMYRTLVGDLQQPLSLIGAECAFKRDVAIDTVEHAFLGLAIETILGVDFIVGQPHRNAIKRQLLFVGIQSQCH